MSPGDSGGEGAHWARRLVCSRTGVQAPLDRPAFLSSAGAPWLVAYELDRRRGRAWRQGLGRRPWSLWRYRELLPVSDVEAAVDLGEGGTPLVRLRRLLPGVEGWLKQEAGNPTGSFKARGLSLAVNRARELGAPGVELPSAGNAAVALAAYAAAAGLPARVALPAETPGGVARSCEEYGAEVLRGGHTLVEAAGLLAKGGGGFWNLATLREPYRVEGKKTLAFEIAEQLDWRAPDWIVYPTGGGTGIVGMHKGFQELRDLGLLAGPGPRFAVAQMAGCAPLVRAFAAGRTEARAWEEPRTRVWGLRVPEAIGHFLVLRALRETSGAAVAVGEETVEDLRRRAARLEGLRVGPEGAAALAAAEWLVGRGAIGEGQRVVVLQTGDPATYE